MLKIEERKMCTIKSIQTSIFYFLFRAKNSDVLVDEAGKRWENVSKEQRRCDDNHYLIFFNTIKLSSQV